jgi:hypothetical protein
MAISQRTATSGTAASGAAFTVTLPTGTTAGDLIVLAVAVSATPAILAPAGWTSQGNFSAGTGQALNLYTAQYRSSLTLTFPDPGSFAAWACNVYSGTGGVATLVDGTPLATSLVTSNTTLPTGAPSTSAQAGDYEVLAYAWTSNATISTVATGSTIDTTQTNSTVISVALGHNNTTSLPASTACTAFSQTLSAANTRKTGVGLLLWNTNATTQRQTGGIGASVDLMNTSTNNQRQTGAAGATVDLQNTNPNQRRTGAVGTSVDLAPVANPTYPITVTARQALAVSYQACGPNPYANLEALTYAQLKTFTYGQLEQKCVNVYALSGTVQQPQNLQLLRSLVVRVTTSQAQAVSLTVRSPFVTVATTQAQSVALTARRTLLRMVSANQPQAVSLAVSRVLTRIVAVTQAQSLTLRKAASLLRGLLQATQIGLTGGGTHALQATQATQVSLGRQVTLTRTIGQAQSVSRAVGQGYQRTLSTTQAQALSLRKSTQIARSVTVGTALSLARGAFRVLSAVQATQATVIQQVRLTRALAQAQALSVTRMRVVLATVATSVGQSLALRRAVTLTRSIAQAQAPYVVRAFGLVPTIVQPTLVQLGQAVRLRRNLVQPLLATLNLLPVTKRYQITVSIQVRQSLSLARATTGKPARVFTVCPSRTIIFPMCQRSAHFAAPRRDVRFTVEVR